MFHSSNLYLGLFFFLLALSFLVLQTCTWIHERNCLCYVIHSLAHALGKAILWFSFFSDICDLKGRMGWGENYPWFECVLWNLSSRTFHLIQSRNKFNENFHSLANSINAMFKIFHMVSYVVSWVFEISCSSLGVYKIYT